MSPVNTPVACPADQSFQVNVRRPSSSLYVPRYTRPGISEAEGAVRAQNVTRCSGVRVDRNARCFEKHVHSESGKRPAGRRRRRRRRRNRIGYRRAGRGAVGGDVLEHETETTTAARRQGLKISPRTLALRSIGGRNIDGTPRALMRVTRVPAGSKRDRILRLLVGLGGTDFSRQ